MKDSYLLKCQAISQVWQKIAISCDSKLEETDGITCIDIQEKLSKTKKLLLPNYFLTSLTLKSWFLSCLHIYTLQKKNKTNHLELSTPNILLVPSNFPPSHGTSSQTVPLSHVLYFFALVSFLSLFSSLFCIWFWFLLSLNVSWGFRVSHSAHCAGSMCRLSRLRLGPYQPRQATRPLMKAALLSMLIQHQLQALRIQPTASQPTKWGAPIMGAGKLSGCSVVSLIWLMRHYVTSLKKKTYLISTSWCWCSEFTQKIGVFMNPSSTCKYYFSVYRRLSLE